MKVIPPLFLLSVGIFLTSITLTLADTVTLKSGEVIEGKITSETDQVLVLDVKLGGITDQKTVSKSDVKTVSKTPADETAFQALNGCKLESHSLAPATYEAAIKALGGFLSAYPQSSRATEVQTTLAAFKEEQARVKAKNTKWENRWYTPEEFEKNKYQLQSQMELEIMKDQVSRRDYIGALNTFDRIEKNYPGSPAYPEGIELAQNAIRLLIADMDRLTALAKYQENQFNTGIVLVQEPEKSQAISARKAQIAAAEAAVAAAEKAGIKWKPLLPLASKSMAAIKTTISTETSRLDKLPVAAMRSSLACTTEAEAALKNRNSAVVAAKLKEAQTLWAQNNQLNILTAEMVALSKKPAISGTSTTASTAANGDATGSPQATPTPTPKPKPKSWFSFF